MKQYVMEYMLAGELQQLEFSADTRGLADSHAEHHCRVIGAVLLSVKRKE
jgi:hypothetical protein